MCKPPEHGRWSYPSIYDETCAKGEDAVTGIKELVQAYYLQVDHDPQSVDQLFSNDAEYRRPGYESLVGRSRLRRFYGQERIIASGQHILEEIIAVDQSAAARGQFRGVSLSGKHLQMSFADFFTFENGLIKARTTYFFMPGI